MAAPVVSSKRLVAAIMVALVAWSTYLAIGSTGYFVQSGLFDARKSIIVVGCMALFLGLWGVALASQSRKSPRSSAEYPVSQLPRSYPGIVTAVLSVIGVLLWVVAAVSWRSVSLSTTTIMGWSTGLLVMLATCAGIVTLSQPGARRGKSLGWLGLLLCVGSFIAFLARMTPGGL